MKKKFLVITLSLAVIGCGSIDITAPSGSGQVGGEALTENASAAAPEGPLDGQWVIAGDDGQRFCLTIQNSWVATLREQCAPGSGRFATIVEAPATVVAGRNLILSATYRSAVADKQLRQLIFTGEKVLPGEGYEGRLRITDLEPPPNQDPPICDEEIWRFALMARP